MTPEQAAIVKLGNLVAELADMVAHFARRDNDRDAMYRSPEDIRDLEYMKDQAREEVRAIIAPSGGNVT